MDNLNIEAEVPWSTTLYAVQNPQHGAIKENLVQYMYAHESKDSETIASGVAPQLKRNLFESEFNFFEQDLPEIRSLHKFCSSMVLEVARHHNRDHWTSDKTPVVHCHESWYHITRNGGYHDYHMHPNCSWCGIYYVELGNTRAGNGTNSFLDPRNNTQAYRDYGSSYFNGMEQFDVEPVEGRLIIFPSYLYHSARPYQGERDRLVVAFNAMIHAKAD